MSRNLSNPAYHRKWHLHKINRLLENGNHEIVFCAGESSDKDENFHNLDANSLQYSLKENLDSKNVVENDKQENVKVETDAEDLDELNIEVGSNVFADFGSLSNYTKGIVLCIHNDDTYTIQCLKTGIMKRIRFEDIHSIEPKLNGYKTNYNYQQDISRSDQVDTAKIPSRPVALMNRSYPAFRYQNRRYVNDIESSSQKPIFQQTTYENNVIKLSNKDEPTSEIVNHHLSERFSEVNHFSELRLETKSKDEICSKNIELTDDRQLDSFQEVEFGAYFPKTITSTKNVPILIYTSPFFGSDSQESRLGGDNELKPAISDGTIISVAPTCPCGKFLLNEESSLHLIWQEQRRVSSPLFLTINLNDQPKQDIEVNLCFYIQSLLVCKIRFNLMLSSNKFNELEYSHMSSLMYKSIYLVAPVNHVRDYIADSIHHDVPSITIYQPKSDVNQNIENMKKSDIVQILCLPLKEDAVSLSVFDVQAVDSISIFTSQIYDEKKDGMPRIFLVYSKSEFICPSLTNSKLDLYQYSFMKEKMLVMPTPISQWMFEKPGVLQDIRIRIYESVRQISLTMSCITNHHLPLGMLYLPTTKFPLTKENILSSIEDANSRDCLSNNSSECTLYFCYDDYDIQTAAEKVKDQSLSMFPKLKLSENDAIFMKAYPFLLCTLAIILFNKIKMPNETKQKLDFPIPYSIDFLDAILDEETVGAIFQYYESKSKFIRGKLFRKNEEIQKSTDFSSVTQISIQSLLKSDLQQALVYVLEKSIVSLNQKNLTHELEELRSAIDKCNDKDQSCWFENVGLKRIEMEHRTFWVTYPGYDNSWKYIKLMLESFDQIALRKLTERIVEDIGIKNKQTAHEISVCLISLGYEDWSDILHLKRNTNECSFAYKKFVSHSRYPDYKMVIRCLRDVGISRLAINKFMNFLKQ